MPKEFQTPFDNYIVPTPDVKGDWGGSVNGDTTSGQGAMPKGVAGIIPEVTHVDVQGAPGPNDQVGVVGVAMGQIAKGGINKKFGGK